MSLRIFRHSGGGGIHIEERPFPLSGCHQCEPANQARGRVFGVRLDLEGEILNCFIEFTERIKTEAAMESSQRQVRIQRYHALKSGEGLRVPQQIMKSAPQI